ncbi:MAG: hypothetical protein M3290_02070 [Actinomycetota bacterium]|nr:hypothetical protein [Actinomycetota bacterium]
METRYIKYACALCALAIGGFAVFASLAGDDWSPSSLVRVTANEPVANAIREVDPSFHFVQDHYDGTYYYTIAIDPLARGDQHSLIDASAYRYGHPGYGWIASILSLGRPTLIPIALLLAGFAGLAIAAGAASEIAGELGWSRWAGLFVAFNPGLIYALVVDTSETAGAALAAMSLLLWIRDRVAWAAVALVGLCFIKEQFVLFPAGLAIWEAIEFVRGRRRQDLVRRALALAVGPALLILWFVYLHATFHQWPVQQKPLGASLFEFPPFGYLDAITLAVQQHFSAGDAAQLGAAAVPLLVLTGGAMALGIARAVKVTSPIDGVFILLAILVFSLTWIELLYPKDLFRIISIQIALLPAVIAGARTQLSTRARPRDREPPSSD